MVAFMPGYTGKMMGKAAKVLAIDKVRQDSALSYICSSCGYTAKSENPAKCPVCSAAADKFEVIDRRVVEAIAEAEGTTLEEAAFDGKKLKWSAEARRALREVSDAYLRRRAKARIEKAAAHAEAADHYPRPGRADDRRDGWQRPPRRRRRRRVPCRKIMEPAPCRVPRSRCARSPARPGNPTLNWGDGDGNLNEVGAGRVMVTALPAHGEEDADPQG